MGEPAAATTDDEATPVARPALPSRIAVDGSAASGKSSVGRRLASHLNYRFLDTGILYRAIAWAALRDSVDVHDPEALTSLANALQLSVDPSEPGSDHASPSQRWWTRTTPSRRPSDPLLRSRPRRRG